MGEIFDRAAALDRSIAERWKTRTREDTRRPLTSGDLDFIVGPSFSPARRITEAEGKAMVTIFQECTFAAGAFDRLVFYVERGRNADNLNMVTLTTDEELAHVYAALGHDVVGKILFKSPGTRLTYAPFDYIGVRDLIAQRHVTVRMSKLGGLARAAKAAGTYMSTRNHLNLYDEDVEPTVRLLNVVHECTHAVQDWKDMRATIRAREADAFIAAAVAEHALRGELHLIDLDEEDTTIARAAHFIRKGNADENNRAWLDAYEAVAKIMDKYYAYSTMQTNWASEGGREKTIFDAILSSAKTSEMLRESVYRSLEENARLMKGINLSKYTH